MKQQIASVQAEATERVAGRAAAARPGRGGLQAELKRLTGGLAPGIKLPKIKL